MIRGVGPVYAKKLVRAFGEKVFDIIETTPDRLREVEGIGPVRAASILAAWAEQKAKSWSSCTATASAPPGSAYQRADCARCHREGPRSDRGRVIGIEARLA
jgi:NAD-dependent DNA ligase